ncbi:MAG: hypothetical protein ACOYEA_07355 [Fermentimonas sp.]
MRRFISCCILSFITLVFAHGQQKPSSDIFMTLGGGLSTLKYDNSTFRLGANIGLNYSYFFNSSIGLSSGVEISLLRGKIENYEGRTVAQSLIDSENDQYDLYSVINGFNEDQSVIVLQIPIMISNQGSILARHNYFIAGGIKLGLPIRSHYESNSDKVVCKGWYSEFDNWAETQKFAGFGEFVNISTNSDLSIKPLVMMSIEVAVKWNIKSVSRSIYTGLYLDYGLNDLKKNSDLPLVTHDNIEGNNYPVLNSILESGELESGYIHDGHSMSSIIDNVLPICVGVKVGFELTK